MICTTIPSRSRPNAFILQRRSGIAVLFALICFGIGATADDAGGPTNSPVSVRATHLLGFAGAKNNVHGKLTVTAEALRFQKGEKLVFEVKIASVQDVLLGAESRQVGGLPMTLGKAAVPFGGGRAVSLFAHKKYDTLTLEYVDGRGGFHGAVFQLRKGEGEILRSELVVAGAHVTNPKDESAKQHAAEVPSENQ